MPRIITDNLDDRREIHGLLHRLPPRVRLEFLSRCCKKVPKNNGNRLPVPAVWKMASTVEGAYRCDREDLRLSNEIYMDLLTLFDTYDLDAVATACELESLVRRMRL